MINDAKELTEFEQLLTENNRLKEKLSQVELVRFIYFLITTIINLYDFKKNYF